MESIELEDIQEKLEVFSLTVSNDILSKMKELCFAYHCDAETIVDTWIAFSASNKLDMNPTFKNLELMEKEALMKKSKPSKSRKSINSVTAPVYNSSSIDSILETSNKLNTGSNISHRSPGLFSPNSFSPSCFTPSMKYASRKGSGEVICSFGTLENVQWQHSDEYSCSVVPHSKNTILKEDYHYMWEKLRDLASILNDMIQDAAVLFKNKHEIEEWGHIQLPSMETIPVIGRICTDGSSRLSDSSLLLEGSLEICSGQNIPLDVSQLEKYSFFPGQIIAGLGMNNSGKKLMLTDVYEGISPPFCEKVPDLENCYDSLGVVIAAGPFSTSDTISYEPLNDLMKYVKSNKPHALILIGPFVDVKNQIIENDEATEMYDDMFQSIMSQIINHIESLSTKVIIVPSMRDAFHHCIYPTPPYRVKHATKRLFLASDPCILNIEGVVFGLTSTDILFHLGKEEISHPQLPDRLGRLCGHILSQRNFYPLYPPSEEINIDYLHFENNAQIPVMPHILILPSDLRHFIKDVHGCCCINPERLTKRVTGGTFARLEVKPTFKTHYAGSIADSVQIEILKI